MEVYHCEDGFVLFDFKLASLPSFCPFLICGNKRIYLITEGICCNDILPEVVTGSGIIMNGEISQWYFEGFPETLEKLREKVDNAISGK